MQKRVNPLAKMLLVALVVVAPSLLWAQSGAPVQYKIFSSEEFLKIKNPNPLQGYRLDFLTDKEGGVNLGGLFAIRPAPMPGGDKQPYHFHRNRESVMIILSGEGQEVIEGKTFPLKAGDVIFIRPMVKHQLVNTGKADLKYLEFFTYPPVQSDFVEVKD
jgi:mannose-6-phosphate isomerase-like protein (cupin superfamily)